MMNFADIEAHARERVEAEYAKTPSHAYGVAACAAMSTAQQIIDTVADWPDADDDGLSWDDLLRAKTLAAHLRTLLESISAQP